MGRSSLSKGVRPLPGMALTPLEKKRKDKILKKLLKKHTKKNVSLLLETSSWLEPLTFVKQIQTANLCLNVERYCISVILKAKLGPLPLEKNPVGPPLEKNP